MSIPYLFSTFNSIRQTAGKTIHRYKYLYLWIKLPETYADRLEQSRKFQILHQSTSERCLAVHFLCNRPGVNQRGSNIEYIVRSVHRPFSTHAVATSEAAPSAASASNKRRCDTVVTYFSVIRQCGASSSAVKADSRSNSLRWRLPSSQSSRFHSPLLQHSRGVVPSVGRASRQSVRRHPLPLSVFAYRFIRSSRIDRPHCLDGTRYRRVRVAPPAGAAVGTLQTMVVQSSQLNTTFNCSILLAALVLVVVVVQRQAHSLRCRRRSRTAGMGSRMKSISWIREFVETIVSYFVVHKTVTVRNWRHASRSIYKPLQHAAERRGSQASIQ